MPRGRKSLSAAVDKELKSSFNLNNFKNKKGLASNVKFKAQDSIPLSQAFQEVTSVPGIPLGHITLLRGHSDTGKTTALLEAAVAAQKRGKNVGKFRFFVPPSADDFAGLLRYFVGKGEQGNKDIAFSKKL